MAEGRGEEGSHKRETNASWRKCGGHIFWEARRAIRGGGKNGRRVSRIQLVAAHTSQITAATLLSSGEKETERNMLALCASVEMSQGQLAMSPLLQPLAPPPRPTQRTRAIGSQDAALGIIVDVSAN